ncbi:alkaline phosphatase family protein [Brevundimonas staleyi]|uniref:Alkaline phosphatase family protein n=1 Tax=Brevundimonas staleyi TaxID=74326 RepID=A0ABW0FSA3_9CAUL
MPRTTARLAALLASCALATGFGAQASAQTAQPAASTKPTLIVTIVVDQFSSNLYNQYRDRFSGGLHTLTDHGLVYANGFQQHAMTETCPGHSTVLTGVNPTSSGIPANDWIDRATGEEVYCLAAPENTLAHGRNTDNGPVGPGQLRATTLADWVKAESPTSRVFAVSGKDRGAINLAGHHGDGVFWLTDDFGFTTYVEPGKSAEEKLRPVADLNRRINARFAASAPNWTYTRPECRALEGEWTVGGQTFRATLPPVRGFAVDNSPLLDELTLEAATELLNSQALGRRGVVDMLGVSLSATDRIGHAFGTQGPEMCEQMYRLDVALGAFLDRLAQQPGVVVVLTADHGGSDFPERMHDRGYHDAVRGDPALLGRLNDTLKTRFNLTVAPLSYGSSGLMVVGEGNKELVDPRRDEIAAAAVEMLRAEPNVAGAWTIEEVLASPLPRPTQSPQELTLLERNRLSAVEGRSPDIVVSQWPNTTTVRGNVTGTLSTHGTAWDYDRGVPIVFWSPELPAGQERFFPIRTIDIAPTLANLIGVKTPDTVEGRCMDLGVFAAPTCPDPATVR